MAAIKTILHPTDFSAAAEYAFQLACSLTRDLKAQLILLHVNPPSEKNPNKLSVEEYKKKLWDDLRRLMDSDGRLREMYVKTELVEGKPVDEICRIAKERECDLIVMGTEGRSGLGRVLLGSIAEAVLRKGPCPVMVTRAPGPLLEEQLPEVVKA